ncbi:hypothetical protein GE107_08225 [Cohnella sp. CFH 77786]|uniref:hypothetical protein n=1 Tax=Cohnella sp. CFH 77786 TaxID=2662265 RepID=UPI001C60C3B3|nr:hypothetical protein [Cohnella sp. CFH 77786]MBW5446046.1 hypothetical protein [Cohnella sp. CFH 77786]
MGTRLLSEAMIRKFYPHLKYVRIHTAGRNSVAIYAWHEDLDLPERDRVSLKRFAAGYLPSYLCCEVKAYSMLRTDGVPPVPPLPDCVVEAAMTRELDPNGVLDLINGMLPGAGMSFERYDDRTGTLHFTVHSDGNVTEVEKELIRQYLYEVIPIGARYEVAYS